MVISSPKSFRIFREQQFSDPHLMLEINIVFFPLIIFNTIKAD